MLNQYHNSQKASFNAPATGIIQRSDEKSFFIRFHETSEMAKEVFSDKPIYKNKPVDLLQAMLTNEGYVLVEVKFSNPQQ